MTMTLTQKRWAIGGGIGAVVLGVGYEIFHHRRVKAHGKYKHGHPGATEDGGAENARGEYGHKKHKHRPHHDEDLGDGPSEENTRGEYGHKKHKHHHEDQ